MNKEPAFLVMAVVYLLNLGLEFVGLPAFESEGLRTVAEFLVFVGGAFLIRSKVFSRDTIREAGLDPAVVQADAKDPDVIPLAEAK